ARVALALFCGARNLVSRRRFYAQRSLKCADLTRVKRTVFARLSFFGRPWKWTRPGATLSGRAKLSLQL
ncbi:hypothetical protein K4A07_16765, partial [Lactiplantibacillus plantarum]|nr:hypothetical protein [Lactiplantibacillus plantarum]